MSSARWVVPEAELVAAMEALIHDPEVAQAIVTTARGATSVEEARKAIYPGFWLLQPGPEDEDQRPRVQVKIGDRWFSKPIGEQRDVPLKLISLRVDEDTWAQFKALAAASGSSASAWLRRFMRDTTNKEQK